MGLVVAALAIGGCVSGQGLASDAALATPSDEASLLRALGSPDPTSQSLRPVATGSHAPAPDPDDSLVGSVVSTLADDGLRVRSHPSVSDDSDKLEPLLPLGTKLLVLDGPLPASGYAWSRVRRSVRT